MFAACAGVRARNQRRDAHRELREGGGGLQTETQRSAGQYCAQVTVLELPSFLLEIIFLSCKSIFALLGKTCLL